MRPGAKYRTAERDRPLECFFLVAIQNSDDQVPAIQIEPATAGDAETLTEVSRRAFEHDVDYGSPDVCGPPGYDSPAWQRRMMKNGRYYKILENNRIVGGLILFRLKGEKAEFGRVFLEPDCQNRGIGSRALDFAESAFPDVKHWALDTPSWNLRNQHVYEKAGYAKVGEIEAGDGFVLFKYEKRIED